MPSFCAVAARRLNSNLALTQVIKQALCEVGLPEDAVQYIDNPDRAFVTELLKTGSIR